MANFLAFIRTITDADSPAVSNASPNAINYAYAPSNHDADVVADVRADTDANVATDCHTSSDYNVDTHSPSKRPVDSLACCNTISDAIVDAYSPSNHASGIFADVRSDSDTNSPADCNTSADSISNAH